MATDYKKLLLNYIDKIVFVGFLVLFLVIAFKVVMSGPTRDTSVPPMPNKLPSENPTIYKERYVLNNFQNPLEPDATQDFTTDPDKIAPGPDEKLCPSCGWIVPRSAARCAHCGYSWKGEVVPPENEDKNGPDGPPTIPTGDVPFRLLDVVRKPVDILFMGTFINPFADNRLELQINWGTRQMTIVPLGDTFHGYKLFPLVEKKLERVVPGIGTQVLTVEFLTIQKPGEKPIVVEKGKTVQENEAVAVLDAGDAKWKIMHRDEQIGVGQSIFDVYAGYELQDLGGEGRTFRVIDVRDTQITLEDKEGKQHVLPISR